MSSKKEVIKPEQLPELREKLEKVKERRNQAEETAKKITEKLEEARKNAPKKGSRTPDQYDADIERLEDELMSQSMSLKQESLLNRKIESLKKERKEVAQTAQARADFDAMFKERSTCYSVIDECRKVQEELVETIRSIEVSARLKEVTGANVNMAEVVEAQVKVPADAAGRILGKQSAHLHELEEVHKVYLNMSKLDSGNMMVVKGKQANVTACVNAINDLLDEIEEPMKMEKDWTSVLLSDKARYKNHLQDETHCYLALGKDDSLVVKGGRNAVKSAIATIQNFFKGCKTVEIDASIRRRLVSNKAKDLIELKQESKGFIQINEDGTKILVYGLPDEISQTMSMFRSYIVANREVTDSYAVGDDFISYLLNNAGANMKRIYERCTGNFKVDRAAKAINITGNKKEVEAGKASLKDLQKEFELNRHEIMLSNAAINLFLENSAARLDEIATKYPSCILNLQREHKKIVITSTPELLDEVMNAVKEVYANVIERLIPILPVQIPAFIGDKGANITAIRKDTGCIIDVEEKEIKLSGLQESVDKCAERVNQFMIDNHVMEMTVDDSVVAAVLFTGKPPEIQGLRKQFDVRITYDKSGILTIMGTKEQGQLAMDRIQEMIKQYSRENVIIPVPAGVFDFAQEMRRSNVDALGKKYEKVTISIARRDNKIFIRGEEESVQNVKKEFDEILKKYEGYVSCNIDVNKDHIGTLLGAKGANIRRMEQEYDFICKCDENDKVSIFGLKENIEKATVAITAYLVEKVIVNQKLFANKEQLGYLTADRFKMVNDIQEATSARINVANIATPQGTTAIEVNGNAKQVQEAVAQLREAMAGKKRAVLQFPPNALSELMKDPTFFVERLRLETRCEITVNTTDGTVRICGTAEGIGRTTNRFYTLLQRNCPKQFSTIDVTPLVPCVWAAIEKRLLADEFVVANPHSSFKCFGADKKVGISCDEGMMEGCLKSINSAISEVSKENVLVDAGKELIPQIIGAKGVTIKRLMKDTTTSMQIINDESVLVSGKEENVVKGVASVNEIIQNYRDTHVSFTVDNARVPALIGQKGNNIRRVQTTYTVRVNIDREKLVVNVSGESKKYVDAAVEDLKKGIEEDRVAFEEAAAAVSEIVESMVGGRSGQTTSSSAVSSSASSTVSTPSVATSMPTLQQATAPKKSMNAVKADMTPAAASNVATPAPKPVVSSVWNDPKKGGKKGSTTTVTASRQMSEVDSLLGLTGGKKVSTTVGGSDAYKSDKGYSVEF